MTRPMRVIFEHIDQYGNRLYVQQGADGALTITITPASGTVAEVDLDWEAADELRSAL